MRTLEVLSAVVLAGTFLAAPALGQTDDAAAAAPDPVLTVVEMAVGTDYDRQTRQLGGEGTVFAADTPQLWCRTRITGAVEPTTVTHVWYHRDKTLARVDLPVNSADWRTVSSKRLLPDWTGPWEVKVLDAAGTVLHSLQFTVE